MAISAVVYSDRVVSMAEFYAATFALQRIAGDDVSHVELSDGESSLVIHAIPADYAGTPDYSPREDSAIKISFVVEDIEEAVRCASRFGVTLAAAGWEWHGSEVFSGTDPEGNVVQAIQRP